MENEALSSCLSPQSPIQFVPFTPADLSSFSHPTTDFCADNLRFTVKKKKKAKQKTCKPIHRANLLTCLM